MHLSKVTTKYQATVPKEIRSLLHVHAGDSLVYEILENETVVLRKAEPLDIEYLRALEGTLNEWNSDEDDQAYRHL